MQPKLKLLRILDILRETDETHPITAPAICERLAESGIKAERKSVCRDINTLIEYGYTVKLCHDNKKGYYMTGEAAQHIPEIPVSLDLIHITVEYKKEDETEDGDYITAELGVPSSNLFANLFTLGTAVKLTAPEELKGQFEAKLAEVAEFYKKRRDNGRMDFWLL